MIDIAMKARIPLIKVRTEDTLNVMDVLQHYAPDTVYGADVEKDLHGSGAFYMTFDSIGGAVEELYAYLVSNEKTLVMVNPDIDSPLLFDAGVLPTPKELIMEHLIEGAGIEAGQARALLPVLGGMTLKDIACLARITMSEYGSMLPEQVLQVRRKIMTKLEGLQQVSTDIPFYAPETELEDWLSLNAKFFTDDVDPRLVPRGLLFTGVPGTGKTLGAKNLANHLKVPLYLLELGGVMQKWVGESEKALKQSLQQIDTEAPCVLLIDEAEKTFKSQDDSGVTSRLLGQLLWWLQEHKSKVLTIMTTNSINDLPKELYRPGRIDSVIYFQGLSQKQLPGFVVDTLMSFKLDHEEAELLYTEMIEARLVKGLPSKDIRIPHAKATQEAMTALKIYLTNGI